MRYKIHRFILLVFITGSMEIRVMSYAMPQFPVDILRPVAAVEKDKNPLVQTRDGFIDVTGLGEELAKIVVSEDFPVEKISINGITEYLERHRPDLLEDAQTPEEKLIKVSIIVLSDGDYTHFWNKIDYLLSYTSTKNGREKKKCLESLSLLSEARDTLTRLEPIIMPPGRMRARFISQSFAYGYENITGLGFHPADSTHVQQGKSFFELCLYPERRKFVGQWERDYAEMLSAMTAQELENEWKRLRGTNLLYTLSIKEFMGDTSQRAHPWMFTIMDRNTLRKEKITRDIVKNYVEHIARMDAYLEWASRHWGSQTYLRGIQSLPKKIEPNFEYIKRESPQLNRDDGSEVPFEQRPVYKILTGIRYGEAFEILGLQMRGPGVFRDISDEVTLTQI